MVRLSGTIARLQSSKILVAGDLMLDTYTIGKARRISPEAPVAVLNVTKEENRPGGAGNAALNFVSLGAQVVLLGRIGNDEAGLTLLKELEAEKIDVSGVLVENSYRTPKKNRIIADNQQIVRVDHEQIVSISSNAELQVIDALPNLFEDISAVAISDYGKGFLSREILQKIIHMAKEKNIPVITDPKGTEFTKYNGTTILKPNLSEAYAAAGMEFGADLDQAAKKILESVDISMLMVTRSEDGISIYSKTEERLDFPVKVREVKDVTGAGDTVLATLTTAIASGLAIGEAVELSNIAAGIAIERIGCARVTISDLARRLIDVDVENKIFDTEHLYILQQALASSEYNLLVISGEHGVTSSIFAAIQQLSHQSDKDLVIYISDENPDDEFVHLIASLRDVKFIILNSNSLQSVSQHKTPYGIFLINGKELKSLSSIDCLL